MQTPSSSPLIQQKGCIFCEATHHKILFSDENFIVALDNFPLTEGHILIFSKSHYGCAGEVPEHLLGALAELKNKVAHLLYREYKNIIFYEHGRAGGCVTFGPEERLCHHFHLHALPLSCDISGDLDKKFPQYTHMQLYPDINSLFNRFGEYLYFENPKGTATFYPVSGHIPSHLLRTMIANAIAAPERADWENFNDHNFIDASLSNAHIRLRLEQSGSLSGGLC